MNLKAGETGVAELVAGPWSLTDEDAELVSAVRAGSEEAFDRLIARYHASVYGLIYRMLGDQGDAADAVQEVFLKVFRGFRSFQAQSSLKTWIFRIAVHEASNRRRWWRRHRKKETSLETPMGDAYGEHLTVGEMLAEEGRSPFERAASEEVRRAVGQALGELPEPYRTTVVLRDLEEFSYEEIAEVLQVSVGTVKSRLARGRETLKGRLAGILRPAYLPARPVETRFRAPLVGNRRVPAVVKTR